MPSFAVTVLESNAPRAGRSPFLPAALLLLPAIALQPAFGAALPHAPAESKKYAKDMKVHEAVAG